MKKTIVFIIAAAFGILLVSSCAGQTPVATKQGAQANSTPLETTATTSAESTPVQTTLATNLTTGNKIGNLAPDFQLKNLDGNVVSLSEFKGKPVWINFWATW